MNVDAVSAEVEALDEAVVSIASSLQAKGVAAVDVDLVVHRSYGERFTIGAELDVLDPMTRVSRKIK